MSFRLTGFLGALFTGYLTACEASQTRAPIVELTPAGDTLMASYSDITEAAWLGGDRWAVLSPLEETAGIVDFTKQTVTPLGGPRSVKLRNPSVLFSAEDTLHVGDWGLRQITLWSPDGRAARSMPAPDITRGALPRARDTAGHFYFEIYPPAGPDGSGNRDSAAVVRSNLELTRADTIARLAPRDIAEMIGEAGRRYEPRVFSGEDQWGVLPDGSLWVARVYHNRVDWRSPAGRWSRGERLPDRVLEVTRYDREMFVRRFPPELRATAQELPFAAIKPPFEAGLTSPEGQVWLEKSRAPVDSSRRYHVVDQSGRLEREIRLQGQGRILSVGSTSALVAEPTPEGTRLLRVSLPLLVARQRNRS